MSFRDSEATLVDPQIARIAEIEDDGERAKALFAYLEDWVPPGERPEVGGDEAAAVSEAGARLEVATSHPSEAEREERLKLVLHERLKEKSAALAVAAGNRFFRLAARSRALEDQLDREFGELDLLMLHLAIEDLRDLDRLGREDEDGEAFPPEVVVPLGDVLRLGPGLTLGHKEVDLLVERANRRRAGPPVPAGEVAAQDAMSVAVSLDADTIGPRLRKLEERVADSETAEAKELQKAANRNVLWKLAAWGGSLGTGVAASVIAATYGVEITAFVQTNWAVLVEAAGTYGPQFARWFVLSMQQVSEFAGLAANVPVPPRAGSRDREE
ncbi:MAG: hypothetical protein QNJ44_06950 [Rhodobacter sp.]|nr:hypothetical protein [Rhodobacter sp.]